MALDGSRRTIGDYFTLKRGTTYKSRLLGRPGPILLGLATIQRNGGFRSDNLKTYGGESPDELIVNPGDLYVSLKDVTQSADLLGAVARLPSDQPAGRLTQDTVRLEPIGDDVPLDYLYWLLRTPQYRSWCRAHATGTTNLGLPRDDFLAFPAPEPVGVQRKIAQTLDFLEGKIELNRRMSETLEAIARALFRSWFVDFDPVRAKAEGRDGVLPPRLADLFPGSFAESDIDDIPSGWACMALGEHVEAVRGLSYNGAGLLDAGLPMLNLNSVYEGGGYKSEGLKRYAGPFEERHVVLAGDVIIANTEQGHHRLLIGYAAIVPPFAGEQSIFSHHLYRVRARPSSPLTAEYLCHLLNSRRMQELVSGYANGTTVNMLPLDSLSRPMIVIPPVQLVEAFDRFARLVRESGELRRAENATLSALRDTLLPKLISGELRVGDADRVVEATL